MTRVSALGEYLRYHSALPPRLRELAILVTAAQWKQAFEWEIHAPIALEAGIPQSVLDALWSGLAPPGFAGDQQVIYDLCLSVQCDRLPNRELVARAEALLGDQAAIDAIALCGYYGLLAMILNSYC